MSGFDPNQPRGHQSNPGRWTAHEHSAPEADLLTLESPVEARGEIDLDEVGSEAAAEEIIAGIQNGSDKFTLTYVAYDEQLNDKQITDLLAGDTDAVFDSVDEACSDSRYDQALAEAKTACEERGVDFDELAPDDQDAIRFAIEERDDSTPVADLVRNTPPQLMRASILPSVGQQLMDDELRTLYWYDDANWEAQEAARVEFILTQLERAGADPHSAEVRQAASDLVTEGPAHWHEQVTLDVIWFGDIADATAHPVRYDDAPDATGRALAFTGARVVLLDTANGSGMDAEIPGNLRVTVTPNAPAVLDSESPGYGWDETAGVVKSAYTPANLASTWLEGAQ